MLVCAGCATPHGGGGAAPAAASPTSATAGQTTLVAIAPPAAPKQTLPEFLGLTGLIECVGKGMCAAYDCLGEAFPDLKQIPSPDALGDDADAGSEAAAAIQQDEEKAAAKVKALRYLAEHGCGCYPGVEEAFLAAFDDCTEEVRYEAAKGLRSLAGHPCAVCTSSNCCSEAVRKKLQEIAYETDTRGCYLEPSPRVRRMARLALQGCGGELPSGSEDEGDQVPDEGPTHDSAPSPEALGMPSGRRLPPVADGLVGTPQSVESQVHRVAYEYEPEKLGNMVMGSANGEPVFEREILARLAPQLAILASEFPPDEHQQVRRSLIRHAVQRALDRKLLCQEARRQMPSSELADVIEQQRNHFASNPSSDGDPFGESSDFDAEEALAAYWLERRVREDLVISVEDLLAYYQAHVDRFQTAKEARWEEVTVPTNALPQTQAVELIDYLRRQALGDTSARPPASGISAAKSLMHGWTHPDQIKSKSIARTVFSNPIGQISAVIRDAEGWHLVRVLQRRSSRRLPFEEVAETIRQEIIGQRRGGFEQAYIEHLRRSGTIWSVFDPPRT